MIDEAKSRIKYNQLDEKKLLNQMIKGEFKN